MVIWVEGRWTKCSNPQTKEEVSKKSLGTSAPDGTSCNTSTWREAKAEGSRIQGLLGCMRLCLKKWPMEPWASLKLEKKWPEERETLNMTCWFIVIMEAKMRVSGEFSLERRIFSLPELGPKEQRWTEMTGFLLISHGKGTCRGSLAVSVSVLNILLNAFLLSVLIPQDS